MCVVLIRSAARRSPWEQIVCLSLAACNERTVEAINGTRRWADFVRLVAAVPIDVSNELARSTQTRTPNANHGAAINTLCSVLKRVFSWLQLISAYPQRGPACVFLCAARAQVRTPSPFSHSINSNRMKWHSLCPHARPSAMRGLCIVSRSSCFHIQQDI